MTCVDCERFRKGWIRVTLTSTFAMLAMMSCQSAVLMTIPEPLAEALPWKTVQQSGAFLGLQTRENDSGSLEDLFFNPGVRVVRVIENSPAADVGVERGDVVLSFDGVAINDPGALDGLVAARSEGMHVPLEVRRDDSVFELNVELVAVGKKSLVEPQLRYRLDPSRTAAGWATDVGGVRLVSVSAESPMAQAGVEIGSLVTALDGTAVHSDRELIRRLVVIPPGSEVAIDYISPKGDVEQVEVELLESPTYTAGFNVPILMNYSHSPERATTHFVLVDLWFLSLFEYTRDGQERTWSFLRFFSYSSGVGELSNR